MIAVDSSVAIAAFGEWHELNAEACEVLDEGAAIAAHAMLETYAVLTGFPPPHRAPPDVVDAWLHDRFSNILRPPSNTRQRALVGTMALAGRPGGAIYDALVGITAKLASAELVTADRRAMPIYELVGVNVRRLLQ